MIITSITYGFTKQLEFSQSEYLEATAELEDTDTPDLEVEELRKFVLTHLNVRESFPPSQEKP